MKIACNLIRDLPHYRRAAFDAGLRRLGYDISRVPAAAPGPDDLLLIWNRYDELDAIALRYAAAGASVLVAENGYSGRQDTQRRQYYALSHGQHHHGGARWRPGLDAELAALAPRGLRQQGRHILVCGQRGIGSPLMRSPPGWGEQTTEMLARQTDRPVQYRPHPGARPDLAALATALDDAWLCVVWCSAAGLVALLRGVPVCYAAPAWIAAASARPLHDNFGRLADLESPAFFPPGGLLNALANEWCIADIESGRAFAALLNTSEAAP